MPNRDPSSPADRRKNPARKKDRRGSAEIDWEAPVRLQAEHILNMPHSQPPSMDGTLRTCVKRAMEWPGDAYPAIFFDRPVKP
jgi:hypothetical protein